MDYLNQNNVPPTLQPHYASNTEWVPVEPSDLAGTNDIGIQYTGGNIPAPNGAEMDYLSSTFLLGNVGAPFVIGLAVGYFAKKMLKIALFIAGGAIVLLFVSEYFGVTTISDNGLQTAADAATNMAKQSGHFLVDRLSRISAKGVSAVAGFFVGLKFG